jgi:tetratricopeptide (TPR) repeat protein
MKALLLDQRPLRACWLLLLALLVGGCHSGARKLLDQAEANWRNGLYDEAIQANLSLYTQEQRGAYAPRAILNIGNIYYLNLRQLKQAIEYYEKLIQEFPEAPETLQARRQLAAIYANEIIMDLDQAIAQYSKLLEVQTLPDRGEIQFQLADAYFKKEDYSRAERELRSLQESAGEGRLAALAELKIGNIYQVEKRFNDAIEPFRKVLSSDCQECRRRAIINLAETYESLFDFDKAIETIGMLEKTKENEAFITGEIERLSKKRREINRGGTLNWEQPKAGAGTGGAARTPTKKAGTPQGKGKDPRH